MSFFREVTNSIIESVGVFDFDYNIIGYGGKALYIEGIKRIIKIAPQNMCFDCGKKRLSLIGEDMTVSSLVGGCVTVMGRIVTLTEEEQLR